MFTTKNDYRAWALQRRRAMTPEEVAAGSAALAEAVLALPEIQAAATILTYIASKDNEADTRPLIERWLREGRQVLAPIVQPHERMLWARIRTLDDAQPNKWGILEPPVADAVTPEFHAGDICLVPALVFSRQRHRIGYGIGYFDRFLKAFPGTSIGIGYPWQLVEEIPVQEHDIPLNKVIV